MLRRVLFCPWRGKSLCPYWESPWCAKVPKLLYDSKIAFADERDVTKVNDMGSYMICKPGAFGRSFNVRFMFFFPRKNRSTSFTDIIQGTVGTENFIIT